MAADLGDIPWGASNLRSKSSRKGRKWGKRPRWWQHRWYSRAGKVWLRFSFLKVKVREGPNGSGQVSFWRPQVVLTEKSLQKKP